MISSVSIHFLYLETPVLCYRNKCFDMLMSGWKTQPEKLVQPNLAQENSNSHCKKSPSQQGTYADIQSESRIFLLTRAYHPKG